MSVHRARLVASAIALTAALGGGLVVAPVSAAEAPASGTKSIPVIVYDRYTVINKANTSNYTNKTQTLGDCLVTRAGSRCSILNQTSASRSVGVALGATRGVVSTSLNISSGSSESVSVQCTSPALPKNARYRAWPRGDRFTYRVKKERIVSNAVATTTTSGTLSTFNPRKNTITCG
jgi:hypothetical protein